MARFTRMALYASVAFVSAGCAADRSIAPKEEVVVSGNTRAAVRQENSSMYVLRQSFLINPTDLSDVVYNATAGGPPPINGCWSNFQRPADNTGQYFAEVATISTGATVTRIRVWGCNNASGRQGSLRIYADAGGKPGVLLFSELVTLEQVRVSGGPWGYYMITEAALSTPFNAERGKKYWYGLAGSGWDLGQWTSVAPGGDSRMYQFNSPTTSYFSGTQIGDMMFQLIGVLGPSDATPPTIIPAITGTSGRDGWYTSDVSVSWNVTDSESDISSRTGCETSSVTADTDGVTFSCEAVSAGGKDTKSVTVKRDASVPSVTPSVAGNLVNGWYTSDVTVTWTASSNHVSGATSTCVVNSLATDTKGTTFGCSITTGAGISGSGSVSVQRDATKPVVSFSGNAGSYTVDQHVAISCSASDATSGLASRTCPSVDADAYDLALGVTPLSATATDNAGNSNSATTNYTVTADASSLSNLVLLWVTDAGVANALIKQLAQNDMKAFINHVNAQSGKKIPADKAAILLRLVGG